MRGIELDLERASAFKCLEPTEEPSFEDGAALSVLYSVHERKMAALDRAVYELIKVQDLVNRLLHEGLGGDLINTTEPDWESRELTRKNVLKGLHNKRLLGLVKQEDFDAISAAFEIPKSTPHGDLSLNYRNRLMHHIKPSVDYTMFFVELESREGEIIRDQSGKAIGRRFPVLARCPPQYKFSELHVAFNEYLDAVVMMLDRLSKIECLRR